MGEWSIEFIALVLLLFLFISKNLKVKISGKSLQGAYKASLLSMGALKLPPIIVDGYKCDMGFSWGGRMGAGIVP